MEEFYKQWFILNSDENRRAKTKKRESKHSDIELIEPAPITNPTEIAFENDTLKLVVEKGFHKRQKNFRVQDHLFYFKIVPKQNEKLPLLMDVFDFLHAAFLHVLESIKSFYKSEDHNIAYLTLHQEPMINGLNTGKTYLILKKSLIDFTTN